MAPEPVVSRAKPRSREGGAAKRTRATNGPVDIPLMDAPSAPVVPAEGSEDRGAPAAPIAARETIAGGTTAASPPEPQEIERRRQLVRSLFNDFWSGRFDKPAAFVDRLNEAEAYLNERLAASGEAWRLDAATRKMLGLPPRSDLRAQAGGRAHG